MLVTYRRCRNLHEVLCDILGHLLSLCGQLLVEIAEPVEQADSHKIGVHVGSLLDIVTSKDAKTA